MARETTGHFSTGAYGNDDARSCLGFAGQGTGGAKYIWFDADWRGVVDDDFNIILTFSNIKIGQTHTFNSPYQFYLAVVPGQQTMPNSVPGNAKASKGYSINLSNGYPEGTTYVDWQQNIGTFGPFNIGKTNQFSYDNQGRIIVYLGGCTTYSVDDPVYPVSMPIYLGDNFIEITDYYPWGRMINNEWKSHNRPSGSLKRMVNKQYVDIKNASVAGRDDHGFVKKNGIWVKSPITGSQS